MFNPVAPYGYLLPNMYLFIADITNPFVGRCSPGLVSTSPAFVRSSASHPVGPHGRLAKTGKLGPHCWGREGSTQFAQQFVTAPPLVATTYPSSPQLTYNVTDFHQLQESRLDTIHGRHRVGFHSDHQTHCELFHQTIQKQIH